MWCVLSFAHYKHCRENTFPTPVTCKNRNIELKQESSQYHNCKLQILNGSVETVIVNMYVVQPKSSRNLNAARKLLVVQLWASRYRELYPL
jgi:hypothetical protein